MPEITSKTLQELNKQRHRKSEQIKENNRYVKGENPNTLDALPEKKPDNRITIPLAKMAVDTLCGYAARPGDIQQFWELTDGETSPDDDYVTAQKEIAKHNDEHLETTDLYVSALTQGVSYELLWVSDKLTLPGSGTMTPEYKRIPNYEIELVWSEEIKPELLAAVRFWKGSEAQYADVYYPFKSERWQSKDDGSEWARDKTSDTVYPYSKVPLAIYPINEDMISLFQAEKGLIDANDKLLNKSVNEIDRFNALIALFPDKVDKAFVEKLRNLQVIDELGQYDKWPEYLEKNLSNIDSFYNSLHDRLERLFQQSTKIPDFTDEEFANAQSGVAMAYKLLGLEFVASKIEAYFFKGLEMRNELINDVLRAGGMPVEDYKYIIKPLRNMPVDKKAAVEMAVMLKGVVSDETILRMLPRDIVDDVKAELERLENQAPEIELSLSTEE